jgi:ketosteroid isomerase-like protein
VLKDGGDMEAKTIVQELYRYFATGSLEGVLSVLSEDIQWSLIGPSHIPYFGSYHGKDGVMRFFDLLMRHEEILEFVPESFICDDNQVVVLGRERCRSRQTGREFEVQWAQVFKVEDGRVSRFVEYIDTFPMVEAYR